MLERIGYVEIIDTANIIQSAMLEAVLSIHAGLKVKGRVFSMLYGCSLPVLGAMIPCQYFRFPCDQ